MIEHLNTIQPMKSLFLLYPKGIIFNKHNIDNQAVTYHFNFIFNGNEYSINFGIL